MIVDDVNAALAALREQHAPTLAADVAALNAFQRVHFTAWASRLAHPGGAFDPFAKPHYVPIMGRRVPRGGDGARALAYREAVNATLAGIPGELGRGTYPERFAIARSVLAGLGFDLSNECAKLPAQTGRNAPLIVPEDDDTSDDLEPAYTAA